MKMKRTLKRSYWLSFLSLWLVAAAWAQPGDGHGLARLSSLAPVHKRQAPRLLKEVLRQGEKTYGVSFLYDEAVVGQKVIAAADQPQTRRVEDWLSDLLPPVGLQYRNMGSKQYVILPAPPQPTDQLVVASTPQIVLPSPTTELLRQRRLIAPVVDRTISGTVTSAEDGSPVPGVNVLAKGTLRGTITDVNGQYTFSVPDNTTTLVFSYVGYITQEIILSASNQVNVVLATDVKVLQDVVVIGYGSVQKKDLIGSVGQTGPKEIGEVTAANAQQLMQGKIAGVQVINSGGLPGSNVNIVVRGTGSFTSTEALYVIDGIQGGSNEFNAIAPADIESITVLKDASSVAIYGARGANGVIMVTTKKAKTGEPRVSYNGYVGVATAWRKLDLLNAAQYIDLVRDITNNQLTDKLRTPAVLQDVTDWQDAIFRTARLSEHNLSLQGGTDKVKYLVSNAYTNQDGIMRDYNFIRNTTRINLSENVGKRFRFGQQLIFRYTVTKGNTASFTDALRMPPYAPIRDPNNLGGFSRVTSNEDLNDAFNPLTNIELSERRARDFYLLGQFYGEVDITDWLTFRSQASVNYGSYNGYNYTQARANGNLTFGNEINEYYGSYIGPLLENFFTFNKTFGKHNLTATLGNTYINGGVNREVRLTGGNFQNDELKNIAFAGQSTITGGSGGLPQGGGISYFARVNYTLNDKYLFTASFRRDGSPVFPAGNKFANFPAVGVAWKITEEEFMKNQKLFSSLKLRASYGITGNSAIPLQTANIFKGSPTNLVYSFGEDRSFTGGATVNQPIDPNTRWETTRQTDVGIDAGFMGDRLTVGLVYYNRDNRDLLVGVPISVSSGFGGPFDRVPTVVRNAANAYNRGIEATLNFEGETKGGLRYSIGGNLAYNRNEVVSLGAGQPFAGGFVTGGYAATRTEAGQPIGSFFGYVAERIVPTQAEVTRLNEQARQRTGRTDATYQAQFRPGDVQFADLNGDGIITEADQQFLGSPIPKWNYGGNLNLGYKNFDFMVSVYGIGGVSVWNDLNYWLTGMTRPFNSSTAVLDRWRNDGDQASFPRAGQNANGNLNLRGSSRFIENGSYLRVRNVTLGYTFPASALKVAKNTISNLRLYVTAQNLFTITNYTGYDPEISAQGNDQRSFLFSRGIDNGQYPQPRSFLLGAQISF
jgi:TonB-linked SusC/RagA family outer membrane protein